MFILETRIYPFFTKIIALDCEYFSDNYANEDLRGKCREAAIINYYGVKLFHEKINLHRQDYEGYKDEIRSYLLRYNDIIVVGQSLNYDLGLFGLETVFPKERRRDLAERVVFQGFSERSGIYARFDVSGIKDSAKFFVGIDIQQSRPHCPVEDAKTSMALYRIMEDTWTGQEGLIPLPERVDEGSFKRGDGYFYYRE